MSIVGIGFYESGLTVATDSRRIGVLKGEVNDDAHKMIRIGDTAIVVWGGFGGDEMSNAAIRTCNKNLPLDGKWLVEWAKATYLDLLLKMTPEHKRQWDADHGEGKNICVAALGTREKLWMIWVGWDGTIVWNSYPHGFYSMHREGTHERFLAEYVGPEDKKAESIVAWAIAKQLPGVGGKIQVASI